MPLNKLTFLRLATLFEGGLGLIALLLGSWLSVDPLSDFHPELPAFLLGLVGVIPLYVLFIMGQHLPWLKPLQDILVQRLGGLLAQCRWYELLYLASLAGITEELLFRGFVQPWLETHWGYIGGLVFSNLIFALVHWITPLYALMAAIAGFYLGLSLDVGESRNLMTPMIIHSLYDFVAFIAVARLWMARTAETQPVSDHEFLP
jgi:membrane protease YdiL (CAAX protease family)